MSKPKGKSKGLSFLKEARPEAVSHLLSFFRESGQNLEPKTRFLISVVTKVINFSERGLQQYVRRAMEAGATADEIIDAILCSYPCSGLTKVVDAIDVILDMGIPGFESLMESAATSGASAEAKATASSEGEWVDIGSRDELSQDGRLAVQVGDRHLAVFDVDGDLCVTDNFCPHQGAPLASGQLCDDVVVCPLHHWSFNIRTGVSPSHPGVKLGVYEVKLEQDGRIRVKI